MSYDLKLENGDLKIGTNGDLATVKDTEKVLQDCAKITITPIGSNKAHSWYGSLLGSSLLGSGLDISFIKQSAAQQLQTSLEVLQSLQKTQMQYQQVTSAEYIRKIKQILINSDPNDPRLIYITESIITNALTEVSVNFKMKIF